MKYRPSSALSVTYCSIRASAGLTRPSPRHGLPGRCNLAKSTRCVAWVTIGKNLTASVLRDLDSKNVVTAVSPPLRWFRVLYGHGLHRMHQQIARKGNRSLGATVHGRDQFVDLATLSPGCEARGTASCKARGKGDAHLVVAQNPSVAPRRPMAAKAPFSGHCAGLWWHRHLLMSASSSACTCCAATSSAQVAVKWPYGDRKRVAAWG